MRKLRISEQLSQISSYVAADTPNISPKILGGKFAVGLKSNDEQEYNNELKIHH